MTLNAYIDAQFPQIKSQLGWSDSVNIVAIVDKTLELYGVATEGLATDLTKLHALADVAVWRQALNDISLDYAFSADNASFQRQQAVAQIRQNLVDAEMAAMVYLPNYNAVYHNWAGNDDWFSEL